MNSEMMELARLMQDYPDTFVLGDDEDEPLLRGVIHFDAWEWKLCIKALRIAAKADDNSEA